MLRSSSAHFKAGHAGEAAPVLVRSTGEENDAGATAQEQLSVR